MAEELRRSLQRHLRGSGIDRVVAFQVGRYDALLRAEGHEAFTLSGRPERLGLLVGNTRALWPAFLRWRGGSPSRLSLAHPLNDYVAQGVLGWAALKERSHEVYFDHSTPRVSMQHLAQASGFAHQGPAFFSVRSDVGPWFALRALLVFPELVGPAHRAEESPCVGCSCPCLPPFERLMSGEDAGWEAWLGLRRSCPVGAEAAYSEVQSRYHAIHERSLLPLL